MLKSYVRCEKVWNKVRIFEPEFKAGNRKDMRKLEFNNNGSLVSIDSIRNFVIVGANGSGKSHLGAAIEENNPSMVLRISAQRALSIPDEVNIGNYENLWHYLLYGSASDHRKGCKWGWREGDKTIQLVNDYQQVLSAVFSKENEEMKNFKKDCMQKLEMKVAIKEVPDSITDRIEKIWDEVFPQRQIALNNAKAIAKCNDTPYQAKFMSDGERVALYLISQCFLAPSGTYIVIDEPEIHLHRTIMNRLWDKIEEACPDNVFVYITHDLEFASGRKEATKIWVKDFNGSNNWTIKELTDDEGIPDELMLEVLGNRKPVLFVEGEKTSYDFMLYRQIYDERYIIPAHNCTKVIELTKAFNSEKVRSIHNLDIKGIIDRDYLSENEIESYKSDGIETLNVAEVENLYLLESIVRIVAQHLAMNEDEVANKVKDFVFAEFANEKEVQLKELCSRSIAFKLQQYAKPRGNGIQDLKDGIENTVKAIDVDKIYNDYKAMIDGVLASKDYTKLLSIYNRKSLYRRVDDFFNMKSNGYANLVLNLLKTDKREKIIKALKEVMPEL